ncbi:hypothetical protein I317_02043 [Kwoniella heveanensis CBS 569]|nr:hypothetical protein I317_02043 [Kwoniella heveanensis CBS 569]
MSVLASSSGANAGPADASEDISSSSTETTTIPPILRLPPELIDDLLYQVPPNQRQVTALALKRVFPDYPISPKHLWNHLVVYRAAQLMPLWRKLKHDEAMRRGVKTFSMQSWRGDADILNNVMRCITSLNTLMLNIGTNFAPDHLEEMFEDPREGLEKMELRFRPYVEQASYYQFLAGSYFDTAIETLTRRWPAVPSFTHLSIVQDLPPRSTVPPTAANSMANSFADLSLAGSSDSDDHSGRSTPPTSISSASDNPTDIGVSKSYTGHGPFGNPFLNEKLGITKPKTFAQPIVFFDIQCLAKFGASPVAQNLTHLRLRVPSRDLAKVLISPPRGLDVLFPSLTYLDISTTNVRIDTTLSTLLRTYSRLEHLVLDRVNLFGFAARERGPELCHDLGGLLVSTGLARGKERERQIAAWELIERTRLAEDEAARIRAQRAENHQLDAETAAEIAARERAEEQQRNIELARSRRGHRSAAQANFSLRDRPSARRTAAASSSSSSALTPGVILPPVDKLYLVLPPLPTLKSIGIGGEAQHVSSAKVAEWESQFHVGWQEGLNKVLGWATHVADKYERARRKADEYRAQELKASTGASGSTSSSTKQGHISKSKRRASISNGTSGGAAKTSTRPPTDVRLFRFPTPADEVPQCATKAGPYNLTAGLIEVDPSEALHREYLEPYKLAIGDAQLFADSETGIKPPCVFCTVPDCEGPARRGAEGERVDGRGGMSGVHRAGCGHLLGRKIWGWQGV